MLRLRNRVKTLRAISCACSALVLGVCAAGCDANGEGGERAHSESSPTADRPEKLCGIELPDDARADLRRLVAGHPFKSTGNGIKATTQKIVDGDVRKDGADLCTAYGSTSSFENRSRFTFYMEDGLTKNPDPRFTRYRMGAMALSQPSRAVLFFECKSKELDYSEPPKPVLLSGNITDNPNIAERDDNARLENLRVLHAVTLAVAKELGCQNNAGLPEDYQVPSVVKDPKR